MSGRTVSALRITRSSFEELAPVALDLPPSLNAGPHAQRVRADRVCNRRGTAWTEGEAFRRLWTETRPAAGSFIEPPARGRFSSKEVSVVRHKWVLVVVAIGLGSLLSCRTRTEAEKTS